MALKLRVISDHYKELGKSSSRLFGVTGGRIGRSPNNDWVLPDPDRYISSHHCKVLFRSGQWILEDTSTNGVFVNGSDVPVSVDGPYALQDGDRLRLGDYEMIVSIDERNDFPPDASGQLPAPTRARASARTLSIDDLGEELDLTDLLSEPLISAPQQPRQARAFAAETRPAARPPHTSGIASILESLDSATVQDAHAPATPPSATRKADDWQMQTRPYDLKTMSPLDSPAALARTETSSRRSDTLGEPANGLEAFCRGAGIDPNALPCDTQNAMLTLAGQMTREVVLGLMEALKNRSDSKSKLRASSTMIQPLENNPLKFSASVDEAVIKLLDPHSSRYLGPVEAIRQSFADLRNHQAALHAAQQAAVDQLMKRIEPNELQERFDRGLKRGALLGAANKIKYWDLYVEFYQVLNQRNEQNLPTVFAEDFARAYSERAAKKK